MSGPFVGSMSTTLSSPSEFQWTNCYCLDDCELDDALESCTRALYGLDTSSEAWHLWSMQNVLLLCLHFERTSDNSAIDKAAQLVEQLCETVLLSNCYDDIVLHACGRIQHALFEANGSIDALRRAHDFYQKASVGISKAGQTSRRFSDEFLYDSTWITTYYCAYISRQPDLSQDVLLLSALLDRTHAEPFRARLRTCLCRASRWQWYITGRPDERTKLEESLQYGLDALTVASSTSSQKLIALGELAQVMKDMQRPHDPSGMIQEAIRLSELAIGILRARRTSRWIERDTALGAAAASYSQSFDVESSLFSINRAIQLQSELASTSTTIQPPRDTFYQCLYLNKRYIHTGRLSDVDETIRAIQNAMTSSAAYPGWALTAQYSLGKAYTCRYMLFADDEDFDSAQFHLEEVFHRCEREPYGPVLVSGCSITLAQLFMLRADFKSQPSDLYKAIEWSKESMARAEFQEGSDIISVFADLTEYPLNEPDVAGDPAELEEITFLREEMFRWYPINWHFGHLSMVLDASALRIRYQTHYQEDDFQRSFEAIKVAFETAVASRHPLISLWGTELASLYVARFEASGELVHLRDALHYYGQAANAPEGLFKDRISAAVQAARLAQQHGLVEEAYTAFSCAIELLPRIAWLGLTTEKRHARLTSSAFTIASDAAASAIIAGHPERAVELLEEGRTVLWKSILEVRTDLSSLEAVAPHLARELVTVARVLDLEDEPDQGGHKREDIQYRQQMAERWDILIDSVRQLDGFESFLRPLSYAKLREAAEGGPIVILNVSQYRSDALIITRADPIQVVPLPALPLPVVHKLAQLFDTSFRLATDRNDRNGRIFLDKVLHTVARSLWQGGLAAVSDILLRRQSSQRGLPRVWWIPTGLLGLLPVHCAGPYLPDEKGLPDLMISSYTTTLTALIKARASHVYRQQSSSLTRLLAVAPSERHYGLFLASADLDIEILRSLPLSQYAVFLTGETATIAACKAALRHCSWVHFSGHGERDMRDPLKNSIRLAGGSLTLSEIVQLDLSNSAKFVFLSACNTARHHTALPDEAMHLAAGLQIAGFKGVVATAWAMADKDGPELTRWFYEELSKDGREMRVENTAEALRTAVNRLRKTLVPMYRWGAFVHYGV